MGKSIANLCKLTLLLLFFQYGWSQSVIITGSVLYVTNSTPKVFQFNFCNPLKKHSKSVQLDGNNCFSVKENMIFSQNMTIFYNDNFINLYVEPGDSIHLLIDASILDKPQFTWLRIQGKDATMREQLNKCADYLYSFDKNSYTSYDFTQSPQEIINAIQGNFGQAIDSLNLYARHHHLEQKVVRWAQQDIKYTLANDLWDYVTTDIQSDKYYENGKKLFTDNFFDIYNEENFASMMFPYHLVAYMNLLVRPVMKDISHATTEQIKQGVELLRQEPISFSRDYMIFELIKGFMQKNPSKIDSFANSEIEGYFTRPTCAEGLFDEIKRIKENTYPNVVLNGLYHLAGDTTELIQPTDLMEYLAQAYPGKIIYMDVYATWCGPCRREFKLAPDIHKQFHGQKVVFVNLCLQSGIDIWKDLVSELHLEGHNYYLDSDATKLFMSTYGLTSFPSYLLLEAGKIKTNRAPRLSDKDELERAIRALL